MKILIIKLGALGDVIRTLPLALALKKQHPDSEITWVTKDSSLEFVELSPYVDKALKIPVEITEKFEVLYNFDIDKEATELAQKIQADKKYGFYSDDSGYASSFNFPAEYYLNTLFDDELKKTNKKTYQEMMFEAAELPYNKEHHTIELNAESKKYAENFLKKSNKKNLIGIHPGSSPRWPSKSWHNSKIIELIKKLKEKGYEVFLFAGPDDLDKQKTILKELKKQNIETLSQDPNCTLTQFASLINCCKAVICSDSLALHVSLALKKPTIALFFCTSPDEIESYNLAIKIVSPKLYEFFPEKMDQYDEELVKSISVEEVLKALDSFDVHD